MMSDSPEQITASYVYAYANELVVELTGTDVEGDIVVRTYQFEPAGDDGQVTAKGSVDAPFASHVADALADEGYEWQSA